MHHYLESANPNANLAVSVEEKVLVEESHFTMSIYYETISSIQQFIGDGGESPVHRNHVSQTIPQFNNYHSSYSTYATVL